MLLRLITTIVLVCAFLLSPSVARTEGLNIGNGIVLGDGFDAGLYWDFRDGVGTAGLMNVIRRGYVGVSVGVAVRDPEIWGGTTRWQKLLAGIDLDASKAFKLQLGPIKPAISLLGAFEPDALTNKGSFGLMVKVIRADIPDVIKWVNEILNPKQKEE